jgi:hypothetical protein
MRKKAFVRPNCSSTYWIVCNVCCKRYFKYDAHFECYTRWCEICQDALPSATALQKHARAYHCKNYCEDCNQVYENIRGHKATEHPDKNNKRSKKESIATVNDDEEDEEVTTTINNEEEEYFSSEDEDYTP